MRKKPKLVQNGHQYKTDLGDGDGKADASVTIGGPTTSAKFVPNITAKKWNNEAWLKITPDVVVNTETETFADDKVNLIVGNQTHRSYVDEDGHLEYEIEFAARPSSDELELSLDFPEDLSFVYQDILENVWKRDGGPGTLEEYLQTHHRSDNVVGSYAVFWNRQGNQYKTGKFCHIYRPKLIDANQDETWAELSIDRKTKKLIIGMDPAWLNSAAYPVIVDPNLGYSTQGGTPSAFYTNYGIACHDTSDGTGGYTIQLHVYVNNAGSTQRTLKLALYSDDGGNDRPQSQLLTEISLTIPGSADDLFEDAYAVKLTASTKYWIAGNADDSDVEGYYDDDEADRAHYYDEGSNDLPATWPDSGTNASSRVSMWADYEPTGYINIGDSMKVIDDVQINIGDAWKSVSSIQINIGDAWKDVPFSS